MQKSDDDNTNVVDYKQNEGDALNSSSLTSPSSVFKINDHTRKLAMRRERREREQLRLMLSPSRQKENLQSEDTRLFNKNFDIGNKLPILRFLKSNYHCGHVSISE